MQLKRRELLKGALALSAASALSARNAYSAEPGLAFEPRPLTWRTFEVTTQIRLPASPDVAQAWIPLPSVAADDWIRPISDDCACPDGKVAEVEVGPYGTKMVRVAWSGASDRTAQIVSRVATRDRFVDFSKPGNPQPLAKAERELYLRPTKFIPTDGIVKATADRITAGATTDIDKARLIYQWIVVNTHRDAKVVGCGEGDIKHMLETGTMGGKCADLNALTVGLARASGIPARDLYGVRVAPSKFGYKSLGANTAVITKAQHCRAEIYLAQWGWVPVDPADVRKVALEEPPGNLPLADAKVDAARHTLFGAWESNWIAYNVGHDIVLPGSQGAPIPFLMYPQGETGGERRSCYDANAFAYTIISREVEA
jgi:transglutaminase-like putative cysteine protease